MKLIGDRAALSIDDVAVALGVSRSTVKRLLGEGRIRSVRCGRRVLVPSTEIERVLSIEAVPAT